MLTKANNIEHKNPDTYMGKLQGVRYGMSYEQKYGIQFYDSLIKNLVHKNYSNIGCYTQTKCSN